MEEIDPRLEGTIDALRENAMMYRIITGKPIGITGEIGEYDAARLLGLTLADARQAGYDAVKPDGTKVQIKTRALPAPYKFKGRMGAIKTDCEWDTVVLVLMCTEGYEPLAIYEADRTTVEHAMTRLPGKSRQAGKLAVREFISISEKRWPL